MACIRPRDPRGPRTRSACPCWTGRISDTRDTRWYVDPVYRHVDFKFAGVQAISGRPRVGRTMDSDHDAPSALCARRAQPSLSSCPRRPPETPAVCVGEATCRQCSDGIGHISPHSIPAGASAAVPCMSAATRLCHRAQAPPSRFSPAGGSASAQAFETATIRAIVNQSRGYQRVGAPISMGKIVGRSRRGDLAMFGRGLA
ncbi:hypothetical protein K466DRAFT_192185 [Polyporus arcularius HHB13444]|uniref:Uncharacterized protein n=1 Tax=Polyporus arcularius HHB13444 TaxID=1314778 RepID=A0A5C3P8V8_9APHY|nr:hypothetical protein K466DRAFT_192185 [Polyporus arcularius HHB13444]